MRAGVCVGRRVDALSIAAGGHVATEGGIRLCVGGSASLGRLGEPGDVQSTANEDRAEGQD
jgi:hypothetical protein